MSEQDGAGRRKPYWDVRRNGVRDLVIPMDAPEACRYWQAKSTDKAMLAVLEELGATPEEIRRYVKVDEV